MPTEDDSMLGLCTSSVFANNGYLSSMHLLHAYLAHTASTTYFLQNLIKGAIRVKPLKQELLHSMTRTTLRREILLLNAHNNYPLLYAICHLYRTTFNTTQWQKVLAGNLPLGIILGNKLLSKKIIQVSSLQNTAIKALLGCKDEMLARRFQLWQNGSLKARIVEVTSKQCLDSAVK